MLCTERSEAPKCPTDSGPFELRWPKLSGGLIGSSSSSSSSQSDPISESGKRQKKEKVLKSIAFDWLWCPWHETSRVDSKSRERSEKVNSKELVNNAGKSYQLHITNSVSLLFSNKYVLCFCHPRHCAPCNFIFQQTRAEFSLLLFHPSQSTEKANKCKHYKTRCLPACLRVAIKQTPFPLIPLHNLPRRSPSRKTFKKTFNLVFRLFRQKTREESWTLLYELDRAAPR